MSYGSYDTRARLRVAILGIIGGLPWKLLKPRELLRRGDQHQRQEEVADKIMAALDRYDINAPPPSPMNLGHGIIGQKRGEPQPEKDEPKDGA